MPHPADTIASYVEALRPIIYIRHFDFAVAHDLIRQAGGARRAYLYSGAASFKIEGGSRERIAPRTLEGFLEYVNDDSIRECAIILEDVHQLLGEPQIIARLRALTYNTLYREGFRTTVFILSGQLVIPPELEEQITVVEVPHPTVTEIAAVVESFAESQGVAVAPEVRDQLAVSFKGLHEFEIIQILSSAYHESGTIDERGQRLILREKEQIIRKSGMVEIVGVSETIDDVGGLENLKRFLDAKARIFHNLDQAIKFGVDIPKGILIVGIPGCGKSLSAKATAHLFKVPLLRLDVGKLLGKYVGESEENMRRALKVAEAVSPCVLWVDEIEKAFGGIGTSHGSEVTTRLFGYFLTWLQEKESTIYVVATANNIKHLPPEFLRRGRFDELFSVSFPNVEERRHIFDIHLKKRKRWHAGIDHTAILRHTQDFTGADIEGVVRQAIENAFLKHQEQLTTEDLLQVIKETKSLKETMQTQIKELETEMALYQFKPASSTATTGSGTPSTRHWSVPWFGASRGPASHDKQTVLQEINSALAKVAAAQDRR